MSEARKDELNELIQTYRLDERRIEYPRPNFKVMRPPTEKPVEVVVVAFAGKTADRYGNERLMYDVYNLTENTFQTLVIRHTSLARELARLLKVTGEKTLVGFKLRISASRTETQDGRVRYSYRVRGVKLPKEEFEKYLKMYKKELGEE